MQLATEGMPLEGDLRYGAPQPLHDRSIGLYATELQFEHPVRREPLHIRTRPNAQHPAFIHFADLLELDE